MALSTPELEKLTGKPVKAKRLGWDGSFDGDGHDMVPYGEDEPYESDDLQGKLDIQTIPAHTFGIAEVPAFLMFQVDGHEADPDTIEPTVTAHQPGSHDQMSHGRRRGLTFATGMSDEQRTAATDLHNMTKQMGAMGNKRPGWKFRSAHDLVSSEGEAFKPPANSDLPDNVTLGEPKECYRNAALTAMMYPEYTYVEGVASIEEMPGFPIDHAWLVDENDNVIDPTWANLGKPGTAYVGIKIDTGDLRHALTENEVYTLFQNWDAPVNPVRDGLGED